MQTSTSAIWPTNGSVLMHIRVCINIARVRMEILRPDMAHACVLGRQKFLDIFTYVPTHTGYTRCVPSFPTQRLPEFRHFKDTEIPTVFLLGSNSFPTADKILVLLNMYGGIFIALN